MKKQLLALVFCFWCLQGLKANDTLTRAQVYNFNVGDTFDFKTVSYGDFQPYTVSYEREIITELYYSQNVDTLFVVRNKAFPFPATFDTAAITDLTSYEIYIDLLNGMPTVLLTDTNSIYNGRTLNAVEQGLFGGGFTNRFAEGLGQVYRFFYTWDVGSESQYTRQLQYFSKGNETWGTPILNSGNLLHYTPIPEECAVWTDNIYIDFPPIPPLDEIGIQEQIHSGNKLTVNGHTYIEMIYRSYDFHDEIYTPDSLIGYYRNDTIGKKALFFDPSFNQIFEYDFNYLCPGPNCLTQVMVGTELRTLWSGTNPTGYIEGVGGLGGLLQVKRHQVLGISTPAPIYLWGTLTSFCVCGQQLYPMDTTTSCFLLSEIHETEEQSPHFSLSPNPATQQVSIQVDESMATSFVSVTDVTGQTVMQFQLSATQTNLATQHLPDGIYLITLQHQGQRSTQKLVVGH